MKLALLAILCYAVGSSHYPGIYYKLYQHNHVYDGFGRRGMEENVNQHCFNHCECFIFRYAECKILYRPGIYAGWGTDGMAFKSS